MKNADPSFPCAHSRVDKEMHHQTMILVLLSLQLYLFRKEIINVDKIWWNCGLK